ncbi:MAG: hypothetical protein ACXVA9_05165 [Bdellovibrionales bacterium]
METIAIPEPTKHGMGRKQSAILQFFGLAFAFLAAAQAQAYVGSISFTDAEKADHAAKIQTVTTVAANCLNAHYADHLQFFKLHGVSRYFGNRRYIKGEVPGRRADGAILTPIRPELRKHGKPVELEDELTSMSCVDFARTCLAQGFAAAGQTAYWQKIDAFNFENGNIGTIIQVGLQALGWKLAYWNPDPSQNEAWDAADRERSPKNASNIWGQHEALYHSVMTRNIYYQYLVNDKKTLVGFGTRMPESFRKVPFFVGTAHIGYHVFVGTLGEVIEAHSVRDLFGLDNMQMNLFNPMGGGGPMSTATEFYRSGIIVVPPGSL